jgi:hypothetical protein
MVKAFNQLTRRRRHLTSSSPGGEFNPRCARCLCNLAGCPLQAPPQLGD